jgi:steroid delta-isomerase-like uncharacterized protein
MPRLLLIFLVTFSLSPSVVVAQERTRDVAQSFMDAWNAHDLDQLAVLCHEEAEYTEVATGSIFHGSEGCTQYAGETFDGAPDFSLETKRIIVDGNSAAVVWVMRGTHTGDWTGLPATGAEFAIEGVSIIETEGVLIRRVADYWDLYTLLQQLGVVVNQEE